MIHAEVKVRIVMRVTTHIMQTRGTRGRIKRKEKKTILVRCEDNKTLNYRVTQK